MASPNSGKPSTHTSDTPISVSPTGSKSETEHTGPRCRNEVSEDGARQFSEEKARSGDAGHCSPSKSQEWDCGGWQDAPNSKCYASFGDQGTTATVGAFGQLLQFSGFLGAGSSGMFSVDHKGMDEPYQVRRRTWELHDRLYWPFHYDRLPSPDPPYGLRFPELKLNRSTQPRLTWTNWRWPRHEYSRGDFPSHPQLKLTIQWMVHEKVVLQRCLLENDAENTVLGVEFSKLMTITDLDHLDPYCNFNEQEDSHYENMPGPECYSWVCVHKFSQTKDSPETARWRDCVQNSSVNFESDSSGTPTGSNSTEHTGHETPLPPSNVLPKEETLDHGQPMPACLRKDRSRRQEQKPHDRKAVPKNPYGISVVCSVAINGAVQLFNNDDSPQKWPLRWQKGKAGNQTYTCEVITAYRMRLVDNSTSDLKNERIPWHIMKAIQSLPVHQETQPPPEFVPGYDGSFTVPEDTRLSNGKEDGGTSTKTQLPNTNPQVGSLGSPSPSNNPGTPQNYLEFAHRRNLEHILSVCAVQLTPQAHDTAAASPLPNALEEVDAVALTCGDMSGHRICWSASFFAFRFLVESYKRLKSLPNGDHESVLGRIERTCRGHLKWLHSAQQQESGQRFGANYWVSGKLMAKPQGSSSWIAEESLLDTGFQILKAAAYVELLDDDDDIAADLIADLMSDWALSWLISMENTDKRKKYAWPHAEKEGVNTFRLDDHVWIWRALKSLELKKRRAWSKMSDKAGKGQLAPRADGQLLPGGSPTSNWEDEIERLSKTFRSEVVHHQVSKRFTTENTILSKRMLATTRSIRGSRFMLHARDTALLYKEPFDFMEQDRSVQKLWRTTIQCQMYHTEYQESSWGKTLRHALYIMLGAKEPRINNTLPNELVQNPVRTATDVLIRSSSPNGLFPGRIDISTNKPVEALAIEEEDMESYLHASFEIPYILLAHQDQVSAAYRWSSPGLQTRGRNSGLMSGGTFPLKGLLPHDLGPVQVDAEQRKVLQILSDPLLNRSIFSDLANHEVFRDVIRPPKKAVPFDKLVDSSNIVKLDDEWLYKYPGFLSRGKELETGDSDEGLKELEDVLHPREASRWQGVVDQQTKRNLRYCIVDVRSSKRDEGKSKQQRPSYHHKSEHLEDTLDLARTAQNSKKRLLSFEMVPKQVALRCYSTTEASEKLNLKDFFRRHSQYAKYTFDHCSMIRNHWESEFHLSYYQLLGESSDLRHGIAPPHSKPFPGGFAMRIVRASVSFRFHGDFFDRHWTCYMLDSTPKGPINKLNLLDDRENCQRKVLEQRYFADILTSLNNSVGEIMEEVNKCLGVESGSFSAPIHTTNAYLSWSAIWQEFEPLIQKLHDDLASSQTVLHQWEAREEDRGKEKPRWTSNDERKYRASITTIRRDIKHETSKLQHLLTMTKSLQDLCSNRLDKAREELAFRSEQNIAMFTYVTVVFLPLGFAASIFSMSDSPETRVAINMVVASIIALAVTIVALMNAKALASIAESITKEFADLTADKKRSSVIWGRRKLENRVDMSNAGGLRTVLVHNPSTVAGSWNLIFWTGYIFIEVPARTITAGCRALGWSRDDPKDGEGLEDPRNTEIARAAAQRATDEGNVSTMSNANNQSTSDLQHLPDGLTTEPVTLASHGSDQSNRGRGFERIGMVARVLLGFVTVPIFLSAWIIQIVCFNAWDALGLLGGLMRKVIEYISVPRSDGPESSLMTHLTKPPKYLRPMKMWKNRLRPEEKTSRSQTSNKAEDGKANVSSQKKTSQAPG